MSSAHRTVIITTVLAAAVAVGSFALPVPLDRQDNPLGFLWPQAVISAYSVLHIGGAILFMQARDVYKSDLRRAFVQIAFGVVAISVGSLQPPILNALDLWDSTYVTKGFISLPFLTGGILTYLGTRRLALLTGSRTWWTRFWPSIVLMSVVSSGVAALSPVISDRIPSYDPAVALLMWVGMSTLVSAAITNRIRQRTGSHYQRAMALLSLGLVGSSITVFWAVLIILFFNPLGLLAQLFNWFGLFAGIMYLSAGYAFVKTKDY